MQAASPFWSRPTLGRLPTVGWSMQRAKQLSSVGALARENRPFVGILRAGPGDEVNRGPGLSMGAAALPAVSRVAVAQTSPTRPIASSPALRRANRAPALFTLVRRRRI